METCRIEGCELPKKGRGYCAKHYSRLMKHGDPNLVTVKRKKAEHKGLSRHPLYKMWQSMRERCENPNATSYKYYGAKGVKVCGRWRESFATFLKDVGERPSKEHTLDRIDNAGDYEPGNIRWADPVMQSRNRDTSGLPKGEQNHMSKLTEHDVIQIRKKARAGITADVLSGLYGVHAWTIKEVVARRSWKHIE